ncbi:MAG: 4Fe-4S binding protein [Bryobacterales bacterium]|nr:4Fe-4S binding protein [Bryobacteraceae bacterium]MDW8129286.1 4Fe-4S binding protein [Bryobacterales bacterium]
MATVIRQAPKPAERARQAFGGNAARSWRSLRRTFQFCFLLLNLWIGAEFYLFVRYWETGGQTPFAARPAGVEGWLPIAGLMNLRAWIETGRAPQIHPAAAVLLATFLLVAWLLRKSFCSWLCPIGTLSEFLWRAGRRFVGRNLRLPRWADVPLRSLKYLLLGFFVWAIGGMSAAAIEAFMRSPYGLIADVKMLNFFRHLSVRAAIVLAALVLLGLLVQNFWCRYLCPYGALLGLASLFSPLRIRRDPARCTDCARCARACPAWLPVDKLRAVRSVECTGCLECLAACPASGALELGVPGGWRMPGWVMAVGIGLLFLAAVIWAKFSGHWETQLPDQVYRVLVPRAQEFTHP